MNKLLFLVLICTFFLYGIGTPPVPTAITSLPKIKLYKGWNLIAPPNNNIFNTSSINNVISIYYFDSQKQIWISGLNTSIQPGIGFWIQMLDTYEIDYKVSSSNNFNILNFQVSKGWNLLGMSAESERINIVSLNFNAKSITTYDASTLQWKQYEPYSRSSLKAGTGFWLETE